MEKRLRSSLKSSPEDFLSAVADLSLKSSKPALKSSGPSPPCTAPSRRPPPPPPDADPGELELAQIWASSALAGDELELAMAGDRSRPS
ncbi:hypothetical protein NL676_012258 [Syzygium grande]|nr:hypothetical protein NL676_012258 [Syzygium grande]